MSCCSFKKHVHSFEIHHFQHGWLQEVQIFGWLQEEQTNMYIYIYVNKNYTKKNYHLKSETPNSLYPNLFSGELLFPFESLFRSTNLQNLIMCWSLDGLVSLLAWIYQSSRPFWVHNGLTNSLTAYMHIIQYCQCKWCNILICHVSMSYIDQMYEVAVHPI